MHPELLTGKKRRQFPVILRREILPECRSLLDLGCGKNSPVRWLAGELERVVGVDVSAAALEESKRKNIHHEYRQGNASDIDGFFPGKSFDCVTALDLLEHFEKDEGLNLIKKMEHIAEKKVVIFTPNGFIPQGEIDGNRFQSHKSGWSVTDMKKLGFRVIGIHGSKWLRGELGAYKFKPVFLWKRISYLTYFICERLPGLSFQLLCIKDLNKSE